MGDILGVQTSGPKLGRSVPCSISGPDSKLHGELEDDGLENISVENLILVSNILKLDISGKLKKFPRYGPPETRVVGSCTVLNLSG